jgi:iron complex outermembrane receptor protein
MHARGRSAFAGMATAVALALLSATPGRATQLAKDLSTLSLEELGDIQITSVSKQNQLLSNAPAAIYVITNEEIRRSGYRRLPEILRLAPNLQVARANGQTYVISARGFGDTIANKLLVLIDGRSVYTPLFSGVFWDMQDVVADDIDRIEVISGPGGTIWGTNAVNGVINVVTRHSRDTQGGLVNLGGGNEVVDGVARFGGRIGDSGTYRVYGKGFEFRDTVAASGAHRDDRWSRGQGGFRMDWSRDSDAFTVQGDAYETWQRQALPLTGTVSGYNVLSRWGRDLGDRSGLQIQAYVDHAERSFPGSFADALDTVDIEAQYSRSWTERNHVVLGGGYRHWRDDFTVLSPSTVFIPAQRNFNLGNIFAQNTYSFSPELTLSLGLRLEANDYTGLEPLPSARLSWQVGEGGLVWGAISRAVRSPSRIDREFFILPILAGGPNFTDEKLVAYELGYRRQFNAGSVSVSAYYNIYDDLRSFEAQPGGGLPITFGNTMKGETHGVEAWGTYLVSDWWRLSAGVNLMHRELRFEEGSRDVVGIQAAGNDPKYQFSLRSSMNLTPQLELDVGLRKTGALPNPTVPDYLSLDARIGWQVADNLDLSVTANNLLDDRHPEFGAAPGRSVFGRSVFFGVRWRF